MDGVADLSRSLVSVLPAAIGLSVFFWRKSMMYHINYVGAFDKSALEALVRCLKRFISLH